MNKKKSLLLGGSLVVGGLVLSACYPTGLDQTFGVDGVKASPLSATSHDRFLAVTPGPTGTKLSSSPHSGQARGGGMMWPQWWQARRWTSRCSTIQAVQLGHWKRWPQWRHKVSGA